MRSVLVIIYILIYVHTTFGQENRTVNSLDGAIVDSQTKKPLELVSVELFSRKNHKLIKSTTSNEKGIFSFTGITEENVQIKFSLIGYRSFIIDSVSLNKTNKLGLIELEVNYTELPEISVISIKPMIEFHADKQILNVARSPVNTGTIADVLMNSGLVNYNPSTNTISIHGQPVRIQMDGRPYDLPAEMVSQVPASTLDQIEVIIAPGVKESAEGGAYIINLVRKKNYFDNFNGVFALSAFTSHRDYGSLNLNYKVNNINLYFQAHGNYSEFKNITDDERLTNSDNNFYKENTLGTNLHLLRSGYVRLGIDYNLDDENSFMLYGSCNNYTIQGNSSSLNPIFDLNGLEVYAYHRSDNDYYSVTSYSISGFYKRQLGQKDHNLTFDVLFNVLENSENKMLNMVYDYRPYIPQLQNDKNNLNSKTLIIRSDYSLPIGKNKFEAGYSLTYRYRTDEYDNENYSYVLSKWQDSLGLSNNFRYIENINAMYMSYEINFDNYSIKFGVRGENLHSIGNQITQKINFEKNHFSLFPNLNIDYQINDSYNIGLNIFRRVTYPQVYFINPFMQYLGPNKYYAGNPYLKPSFTNSLELNFSQFINLYYHYSTDVFSNAMAVEKDSVLLSSYVNLTKAKTYGIDLMLPYYDTPDMFIHLPSFIYMLNIRFSYRYSNQEGGYLGENLTDVEKTYDLNASLGLKLWYGITAMLSMDYSPMVVTKISKRNATNNLSLFISKSFLKNKLRISINGFDLLNSMKTVSQTYGSNFYLRTSNTPLYSRGIGIGITYFLNDYKTRHDRNIDDGRDALNSTTY